MTCLARSGVRPITEMTMSTLSVSKKGIRLAAVTCCSSTFTPRALATISARSMSKPSGLRSWFTDPNGGTSSGAAMRTTPFLRISANASARASAMLKTSAIAAIAAVKKRCMRVSPTRLMLRDSVKHGVEKGLEFGRARRGQDIAGATLLPDASLVHKDEASGHPPRETHLVRDEHHRHAFPSDLLEHLQHLAGELGVEGGGDLVKQHKLRFHGERAGYRDALLLAARELVGIGIDLVREADAGEGTGGEFASRLPLDALHHARRERDVPFDREMREEIVALEDDAHPLAQLAQVGSGVIDRLAVEHDPSFLDRLEPVDAAQHGALARTRTADDGDDLSGLDRQ